MRHRTPPAQHAASQEIRALLSSLLLLGFRVLRGNVGDGKSFPFNGVLDPFIAQLTAEDETMIAVSKNNRNLWIYLVLDNEPGKIVVSYSDDYELLDRAIDQHCGRWARS